MYHPPLSCYLCHDESVAKTKLSIEDLFRVKRFPGAKMFKIFPGIDIIPEVSWMQSIKEGEEPLVVFTERYDLTERRLSDGKDNGRTLPQFGDKIGQTIIVCDECSGKSMREGITLDKLLQKEFSCRMAQRYEYLCRSLLRHSLLVFDTPALEKFADDKVHSVTVDAWEEFLLELRNVAPQEYIRESISRLEPLTNAIITKRDKVRLKTV